MEDFKTTKLTVAKICHEIANYLSVMKFLQEDLINLDNLETLELVKNIDLMSCVMDFFRNAYSDSIRNSNLLEIIKNICALKNIEFFAPPNIDEMATGNELTAICIISYILIKTCKPNDKLNINFNNYSFIIEKSGSKAIPQSVIDAINNDLCETDVSNVLVKYAKELLNSIGYKINIETDSTLKVKIWK